jgi:hypothetical protein
MSWEAANIPKATDYVIRDGAMMVPYRGGGGMGPGQKQQPQGRSGFTETVEAALSRLSKAYNTSMDWIVSVPYTRWMR